jgi:hypothetical protein
MLRLCSSHPQGRDHVSTGRISATIAGVRECWDRRRARESNPVPPADITWLNPCPVRRPPPPNARRRHWSLSPTLAGEDVAVAAIGSRLPRTVGRVLWRRQPAGVLQPDACHAGLRDALRG